MLTIHHLGTSQSERIIRLCEGLGLPTGIVRHERDLVTIAVRTWSRSPCDGGCRVTEEEARRAIADLERELDGLAETAERCGRTETAGKFAALAGGLLLAIGFWRGDATMLLVAIAAGLGGLALSGSTRTTRHQIIDTIAATDARRSGLIDALRFGREADVAEDG